MEKIKEYKEIIILIVIIFAVYFFIKQDKWLWFYYPGGCLGCSENYIYSPEFKTKDECFDWAYTLKDKRNNPDDLFECGRNCKTEDGIGYVCQETVD